MPVSRKPQKEKKIKVSKKNVRKHEYIAPSIEFDSCFTGFYSDSKRILGRKWREINQFSIYDISSKKITNMDLKHGSGENSDLRVLDTALSPDGKTLMLTMFIFSPKIKKQKKYIKIFDANNGKEKALIDGNHKFISFSDDSKNIATFDSGYVCILSVSNGKEMKRFKIKNVSKKRYDEVVSQFIKMSPDFKSVGIISDDGSVSIKSISSDKEKIIKQQKKIELFCFSSDGKNIATVHDNIIAIFEIATGKEIKRMEINYDVLTFEGSTDKYDVKDICFSPDGKSIASYSNDGFARIFDLDTSKEIFKSAYLGEQDGQDPTELSDYTICFSPNSNMVVVYNRYRSPFIFDLTKSNRVTHKFPVEIGFSFSSETEDLDISKLSAKEKELVKETALLNITNLNQHPMSSESPDINLKNCKFTFDKDGLTITAFTNYNPSSTKMRQWMRWDLYWFNDRGNRIYPNKKYSIEINGKEVYLQNISLTPFLVK